MNQEIADRISELAGLYGRMVYATAYRILGNAEDAEDALQEVFLRMLTRWTGRFRPEAVANWGGYLRGAAARSAIDILRRKKRRRQECAELSEEIEGPPGQDPRTLAAKRQRSRMLREALGSLPHRDAKVFALRYFEEFSYEEIAAQMGLNANQVGVILHRSRKRLQEILEPMISRDAQTSTNQYPRTPGKESNHVAAL